MKSLSRENQADIIEAYNSTSRYFISLFWMTMSPGVPCMEYSYLNLSDSPELLQILVT